MCPRVSLTSPRQSSSDKRNQGASSQISNVGFCKQRNCGTWLPGKHFGRDGNTSLIHQMASSEAQLRSVCVMFGFSPQRKPMGSSAQNSSGVHWCRRRVRLNFYFFEGYWGLSENMGYCTPQIASLARKMKINPRNWRYLIFRQTHVSYNTWVWFKIRYPNWMDGYYLKWTTICGPLSFNFWTIPKYKP